MNGHPLALLPALHCCYVAVEVSRDFLPRIQAVFERFRGDEASWNDSPIALLIGPR